MNTRSLLLFLLLLLAPAWAETVRSDHTEAELVAETAAISPGQPFTVALRLKMDEHWHTYWKNPGDSGLATAIEWELPPGYQAGPIQWPRPERIEVEGLVSYAYDGEIYLLTEITPSVEASGQATLKAKATWLECDTTCIPGQASLSLTLPVGEATPGPAAEAIKATRAKLPAAAPPSLKAGWAGNQVALTVGEAKEAFFFPDEAMIIATAEPQMLVEGRLMLVPEPLAKSKPERLVGTLAVDDQTYAIDLPIQASAAVPPAGGSLPKILLLALLGGLILNLMPCVLPVLSLKVLGFVEQANEEGGKPFLHGLVFSLGVLLSFLVIAGALLGLRAAGQEVGWGFQLQNPIFVSLLALLFVAIALNLFGVFEVGEGLTTLGDLAEGKKGYGSSFTSGILATVVATPCTAPFMGSAVGFTLDKSPLIALSVFLAVGLGMASPYLVLTSSPQLLRFVPRPGAWMETFKQFLAFPMLFTAVWLGSVVASQEGTDGLLALLVAMVLLGMAAWCFGRWGQTQRGLGIGGALVLVALSLSLVFGLGEKEGGIAWQPYDPQLVSQLQADGKPVFIDFTADWCLSCKANEKVALSGSKVKQRFEELGITTMKADWTSRDETITQALASFGRNGVPLYVLYPGGGADPVILPEVLLPATVLEALDNVES